MSSTRASHVEKIGDEKLAESRCPESGAEMEARKSEIAIGDCERVGEEWKNNREKEMETTDRERNKNK